MRLGQYVIDDKKRAHVCWWAAEFEVSEEVLLAAIAAVGNRADAIQDYLNEQKRVNSSVQKKRTP